MDSSTDKPLPRDDEPIERAFVALDAKLAIWAEAASQLSVNLASAASELAAKSGSQVEPVEPTVEPEPGAAPDESAVASDTEDRVEPVEAAPPEPETINKPQPQSEAPPAKPDVVENDAPLSDDELLAELEPELANKIKVMRRLNPDRDVREMIEQYQAKQQAEAAEQSKKQSWWKRKRK